MIVPPEIERKFNSEERLIQMVSEKVRDKVLSFCENENFAFVHRIKNIESLSEKIESGRYRKWSELDDLFACTIVIPTRKEEEMVLTFLRKEFCEKELRRGKKKSPEIFRFDSTRFIGHLKSPSPKEDSELLEQVLFEIQIRSAFEHAWAVTTHALTYKSNQLDWKRLRLSAQLKATVEQLDMLIMGFEESSKFISEYDWPILEAQKKIVESFEGWIKEKKIPSELAPKDFSRFSENFYSLLNSGQKRKGTSLTEVVEGALKTIDKTIFTLHKRDEPFPRSISLFQFVFGVLAENNILKSPLEERYTPIITPQLQDLYPAVKQFKNEFKFI